MAERPFSVGVLLDSTATIDEIPELSARLENAGFDSLYIADHLSNASPPLMGLAAVAFATTRLRLGTYVLNTSIRQPEVLSGELSALARLCGGRLLVGIGAGWRPDDYDRLGTPMADGPTRFNRLVDNTERIQEFLRQPDKDELSPLLIGGARKRVLEFAAREAAAISITARAHGAVVDERDCLASCIDEKIGWIRAAAGERFDSLDINIHTFMTIVTPNPDALVLKLQSVFGCTSRRALNEFTHLLVGTADEVAEILIARRKRWSANMIIVPSSSWEGFSPVVELLRAADS